MRALLLLLLLQGVAAATAQGTFGPPLSVFRPEPGQAEVGLEASFSCVLGAGLTMSGTSCAWRDPAGVDLVANIDTGEVVVEGGDAIDGLAAFGNQVCRKKL